MSLPSPKPCHGANTGCFAPSAPAGWTTTPTGTSTTSCITAGSNRGQCPPVEHGVLDIEHGVTIGLVVETQCNYFSALAFPQDVEAGLRVAQMGRSSVRYEIGLFAQGEPLTAASGHFVHVYVTGRPAGRCRCPNRSKACCWPCARKTIGPGRGVRLHLAVLLLGVVQAIFLGGPLMASQRSLAAEYWASACRRCASRAAPAALVELAPFFSATLVALASPLAVS